MPIEVQLDLMLLTRKISLTELSQRVGISITNLSILKRTKPGRFDSLPWMPSVKNWSVNPVTSWLVPIHPTSRSRRISVF